MIAEVLATILVVLIWLGLIFGFGLLADFWKPLRECSLIKFLIIILIFVSILVSGVGNLLSYIWKWN